MATDLVFSGSPLTGPPWDLVFAPAPRTFQASGWCATHFGPPTLKLDVVGFSSTQFGAPRVYPPHAVGFKTTQFGTPFGIFAQIVPASGFLATQFGTPSNSRAQPASGFVATNFGTPLGWQHWNATGFLATNFGTPSLKPIAVGFLATKFGLAHVKPIAIGWFATHFGSVSGRQHWNAVTLGPVTRFGRVFYAFAQSQQASGFQVARFGRPGELGHLVIIPGRTGQAFGFSSSRFGSPAAGWLQDGAAASWVCAVLGIPSVQIRQAATGFYPVHIGAPFSRRAQRAAGANPVSFGTPTARMTQHATGSSSATQFGLPTSERSNTFKVYGFTRAGRFGQPTGFIRFNHPAAGFSTTHLGVPTCAERHRVAAIAPCALFGRAMLKRNTAC